MNLKWIILEGNFYIKNFVYKSRANQIQQTVYSPDVEINSSPPPNQLSNYNNRADDRPLNSKRNTNFTPDESTASPPLPTRKVC